MLLSLEMKRGWQKEMRSFRLIVKVAERAIDKKGAAPLMPEIELEGWWASLDRPMAEVIEVYKHHGTHEQFHYEGVDR